MELSTRGLVIREVTYKEADKILTILTEDAGKLTVSAHGARRKQSKYTAASQLLAFSELDLYRRNGRWSLREGRALELFDGLRHDIYLLSIGAYFAELLEAASDEDYADPALLRLGLIGLHILGNTKRNAAVIKAAFEFRLMCQAGYAPETGACPMCALPTPVEPMLALHDGHIHCKSCPPEGYGTSVPLDSGSLSALRHIVAAEEGKVFAFTLGDSGTAHLREAAEAYVLAQLERSFRTLDFLKKFRNDD